MSGLKYLDIPDLSLGSLPLSLLDTQIRNPREDGTSLMTIASVPIAHVPRSLCVYDTESNKWSPVSDAKIVSKKAYLYVSYRRDDSEVIDMRAAEFEIQSICTNYGLDAYWVDYLCLGKGDDRLEDICGMGDIIKKAAKTLIILTPENNNPRSPQWLRWGARLWTLVELIFSRSILWKAGADDARIADGRNICKWIYHWEDQDIESKLVYCFTSQVIPQWKWVEAFLELIRIRAHSYERMSDIPSEPIFALMAFLPQRVIPTKNFDEAFFNLMETNMLHGRPIESSEFYSGNRDFKNISIPVEFFFDAPEMFHPSRVMVYRKKYDDWVIEEDERTHIYSYLAISCRYQFELTDSWIITLENLSQQYFKLTGYWINTICVYGTELDCGWDLYHMADVYLRAKETMVMLPSYASNGELDESRLWSEWGKNKWSLAEALFCSNLHYWVGIGPISSITRREVFVNAYGVDSAEMTILEVAEGKQTFPVWEIWAYLIDIICRRK